LKKYNKLKEVKKMKIVNPLGRGASAYTDANYTPDACMCSTGTTFSTALGFVDTCDHCGCTCLPWNAEANFNAAYNANYASG
jgi:putative bacteriocin precursor